MKVRFLRIQLLESVVPRTLLLEDDRVPPQEGSPDLHKGHPSVTKGASPSAKHPLKVPFTKAWRELRRLQGGSPLEGGGLKGAWRGLQGGLKGASRGLEAFRRWRGLRGAWRGLEGGFSFGRLQGGLKGASRGLEGGFSSPCPLASARITLVKIVLFQRILRTNYSHYGITAKRTSTPPFFIVPKGCRRDADCAVLVATAEKKSQIMSNLWNWNLSENSSWLFKLLT